MTLSVEDRVVTYTGNGSTTAWAFSFYIEDADHLEVSVYDASADTTTIISPANYSVTGIGSKDPIGGTVTYPTSGDPLTSDDQITLKRTVPYKQELQVSNQGGYDPSVLEDQLDKIVMQTQQLAEEVGRSAKYTNTSGLSGELELPTPQAGKTIGWNGTADGLDNIATTSESFPTTASRYLKRNSGGTAFETKTPAEAGDDVIPAAIAAASSKPTPVAADKFGYLDSAASDALVRGTWGELRDTLLATIDALNGGPLGGYRNKIINGNFDIWQRGTSFTVDGYTADRWKLAEGSGAACTISRQTHTVGQTDVPKEPKYFLRFARGTAGSAASYLQQPIESVRTFAGQKATVTFYAKATAATELEVDLIQDFGAGGSSDVTTEVASAISLTTSWQKFTYTVDVPSISGKTIGIGSDDFLALRFTREHDDNNPTTDVDISRVSVVPGNAITEDDPYEFRPVGVELTLCQRYYERADGTSANFPGFGSGTTAAICHWSFSAEKRSAPSLTGASVANAFGFMESDGAGGLSSASADLEFGSSLDTNAVNATIAVTGGTGLTNHRPGFVYFRSGGYFAAEAEL